MYDFVDYTFSDSERFDHVITTEFLEHVEDPDKIFNKLYKISFTSRLILCKKHASSIIEGYYDVFSIIIIG